MASLSSRIAPNTDCSASRFCGGTLLRMSSARSATSPPPPTCAHHPESPRLFANGWSTSSTWLHTELLSQLLKNQCTGYPPIIHGGGGAALASPSTVPAPFQTGIPRRGPTTRFRRLWNLVDLRPVRHRAVP